MSTFSIPSISTKNPKEWYVWFRFSYLGKDITRKVRGGINRIKDKASRMQKAEQLRQQCEDWLKSGWNPITDPEFKLQKIRSHETRKDFYLIEALDFASNKKKLSKASRNNYRSMLNFIKKVAHQFGYHLLPVTDFNRGVCLNLIDACAEVRNFSNHNYNKHVAVLRAMFGELVQYSIVTSNPLADYRDKVVPESNKFEDYTPEDKKRIAKHLLNVHPQLFTIMSLVYHTGIRPKEILTLRVKDIDLETGIITIAPEEGAENSKTNNVRRVPINPHLEELLKKMELNRYPGSYYMFGAPSARHCDVYMREDGSRVFGVMRPDYLMPHPYTVKRDTITRLWKKLVMDDGPTGLSIKKHLYAAKHTGTDDKTDSGLDIRDMQVLYGHKSEAMTERYQKRKRETDAKREILAKSPAFV